MNFLRGKAGIVYRYFIPNVRRHDMVVDILSECLRNEIEDLGFPIIRNAPYPDQLEISVKRALFPHFIYAVDVINSEYQYSVINPAILNIGIKDMLVDGMSIDQSNFERVLRETNYLRYGNYVNNRYYAWAL